MQVEDNGLGLEAFVRGSDSSDEGATAPSHESEPVTTVDESAKPTTETDAKPPSTEPDKKEGKEEKPSPSDSDARIKSEVDKALGTGDKKEAKPEGEKPPEPAKEEQPKTSTWDSDENPYRRQAGEAAERLSTVEQQLINTRNWATAVNQRNKLQERQLQRMEKKIDGSYDPEEDRRLEAEEQRLAETGGVSPEQAAAEAELKGATAASLHMAYEQQGKEKTNAEIREFDQLFQRNPVIMQRVVTSRRPIQEAMKVLGEFRTAQKYGTSDMMELIGKVKEEAIAEATPALVEKITKEIMGKLSLKDKETTGIRSVRGTGRESVAETLDGGDEDDSLGKLFPN